MSRPPGLRPTERYREEVPPPRSWGRPTWAEVDLGALRGNLRDLRRRVGPRPRILLVVKADGYGHGAAAVARAAERAGGVRWLGVSSVEEGVALRERGIALPILILGSLYPFANALAAARWALVPTVASLEGANRLAEAGRALRARGGRTRLSCHLKLDTGMGRIGVRSASALEVVEFLSRSSGGGVSLGGIYTHLGCAESDPAFTREQLGRFRAAVEDIGRAGYDVGLRHAANSAAALRYPESRWDLVRPGLAAYGLYPGFEPVLSLKTRIVFLKNVPAGTPIGYGACFRTRRASRIATLPIGYADGLPRVLSLPERGRTGARALVRGRPCPLVGAMSMDMTTLDVTGVPEARVGDEVVLIGRQGAEQITAGQYAELAGTIPYEITCRLAVRVPRVYLS